MTYSIIYMDPPWKYSNSKMSSGSNIQDNYPTMTMAELKELPIKEITEKDSLIYMWSTSPFISESIELARHWGFSFRTVAFVWDKQSYTPGFYTGGGTEQVLVFKKKGGKIPQPRGTRNEKQFLSQKKREHSRKPDEIRNAIYRMHPTQSKLEMFARVSSEGWDVWGNETNKFNINETELF